MSDLPTITAVCLTYARVRNLENAIANFLAQDYPGRKHMVVLNTCHRQKLLFQHPEVDVFNFHMRPSTIGETRNVANSLAPHGLIVHWDDDDGYRPNHLSNFARGFAPDIHHWVWLSKQLYMDGDRLKGIVPGTANVFAYTKKAWLAVGGFARMNCGEDRNFQGRVSSQFEGVKVRLLDEEASLVYRWGQGEGVYHLSGLGDDQPGKPDGMKRSEVAAALRIGAMQEPQGEIVLNPKPDYDYEKMTQQFTGAAAQLFNARRGRVAIVSLGHMGDILNVLPIALHVYRQTGRKPLFVSTKTYGGRVLDGCSYVEPLLLDIPDTWIIDAMAVASQKAEYVLCAQVYGDGFTMERTSSCYNIEQWRVCGLERHFWDTIGHPLWFNRRIYERESLLLRDDYVRRVQTLEYALPLLLLHLTGGQTSPFKSGATMAAEIRKLWADKFSIVDLAQIKAERIYDMSGILKYAAVLVSSDTYPLHLSAMFPDLPVVAIVNDQEVFGRKWMRTAVRLEPALEIEYSQAASQLGQIHEFISNHTESRFQERACSVEPGTHQGVNRIIHATEIHPDLGIEEASRKAIARKSWQALYKSGAMTPCYYETYQRTAQSVGDQRPLPFLKDVLEHAMSQANGDDVIMFTNDDVLLQSGIADVVRLHVSIWGACTAMRVDFKRQTAPPPGTAPEDIAAMGEKHCGRDLFAATKEWLMTYWDEIPDFILGVPLWDLAIADMVRSKVGHKLNRQNMEERVVCAELPAGYVYHQHHHPVWVQMPRMNPAHKHNSEQFQKWAREHHPDLQFIGGDI